MLKKMSRKMLRAFIIKEIDNIAPSNNTTGYHVWFCSRSLTPDILGFSGHHAWVTVNAGDDIDITLSGKSGAQFTADRFLKLNFDNLINPIELGRDEAPDQIWFKAKLNYQKLLSKARYSGNENSEDIENAIAELQSTLEDTTWKNLKKRKGWSSDTTQNAEVMIEISSPNGMSMKEFVDRIIFAYNGYDEKLPYDPLPEVSSNPDDRNSNSFAFSLLRTAYGGKLPPEIKVDTIKYPGSSQKIIMRSLNRDFKLPPLDKNII